MSNKTEILTNQSIKDELEKIRAEFEDFSISRTYTEMFSIEVPVAVSRMLEDMAYDCRQRRELPRIENLTKQMLCVLLIDAIIKDYQAVISDGGTTNNPTISLIGYLKEHYAQLGIDLCKII